LVLVPARALAGRLKAFFNRVKANDKRLYLIHAVRVSPVAKCLLALACSYTMLANSTLLYTLVLDNYYALSSLNFVRRGGIFRVSLDLSFSVLEFTQVLPGSIKLSSSFSSASYG
jgi:hypothetical protein